MNKGHDFKIAHKFNECHLLVEGMSRINVKLAAQVFSNSVSKAIAYGGTFVYFNLDNWKYASRNF